MMPVTFGPRYRLNFELDAPQADSKASAAVAARRSRRFMICPDQIVLVLPSKSLFSTKSCTIAYHRGVIFCTFLPAGSRNAALLFGPVQFGLDRFQTPQHFVAVSVGLFAVLLLVRVLHGVHD